MAEEVQTQDTGKGPMKRRVGHKKGGKAKKKLKVFQGSGEKAKINQKMQKIYRKRARDYNSDDEDEDEDEKYEHKQEDMDGKSSDEEGDELQSDDARDDISEDEDGEIQPGVTKFTEGCNAFRMAFKKITKKNIPDDLLGPVLSAHKKLLAEKLADEEAERNVKGEAKKAKILIVEKGHVKPESFSVSHEKFLIGVATKGVVKLFNAVNKAQHAQKGLNPSRTKDAKVLKKRRKEAFFSELGRASSQAAETTGTGDGEGPSWAPLRDSYMLTNHKLKDWDKMQDTTVADEDGAMSSGSSSDDEDD